MYEYVKRLKAAMDGKYPSEYVDYCVKYAENLLDKNMPVIFDRTHVEQILRLWIIRQDSYHTFYILGKHKKREITAPSKEMKKRQKWILKEILEKVEVSSCCHGFVLGKSIVTNAQMHVGHKNILNIDLKDFFPSVTFEMVQKIFKEMGYCSEVANALASLSCHEGVLPQGAPTSPYLANLALMDMDKKLLELCNKEDITYTRYADDMSFSSDKDVMAYWDVLKMIVEEFHFNINEKKTVYYQDPYRKIVTGLIVKEDRVSIPKAYKKRLKQEIYYCRKYGVLQHLQNTGNAERTAFKEYLYGKAYYIHMAEPEAGQKFLAELDKIEWGY